MRRVFHVVLFLMIMLPLHARIGETSEECIKRYGNPIDSDYVPVPEGCIIVEGDYHFSKNGFDILVHFYEGKADYILFSASDFSEMSDKDVATLLDANIGSGSWKEDKSAKHDRVFISSEKKILADYSHSPYSALAICTLDYYIRLKEAEKRKEDERLRDF